MTYRKHDGDPAPGSAGAVQLGGVAQPQLLVARGVPPAQDGGPVEEDVDALARRQLGDDAGVGVGEGDLSLRRRAWRGGERGRLVRSVNHDNFYFVSQDVGTKIEK